MLILKAASYSCKYIVHFRFLTLCFLFFWLWFQFVYSRDYASRKFRPCSEHSELQDSQKRRIRNVSDEQILLEICDMLSILGFHKILFFSVFQNVWTQRSSGTHVTTGSRNWDAVRLHVKWDAVCWFLSSFSLEESALPRLEGLEGQLREDRIPRQQHWIRIDLLEQTNRHLQWTSVLRSMAAPQSDCSVRSGRNHWSSWKQVCTGLVHYLTFLVEIYLR